MPISTDAVEAIFGELYAINRTSRSLLGDTPHPGLTPPTAGLLSLLVKDGERRSGDLADALGIDPSSVSRKLADLERLGLVARRPDPVDGRAWLNSATAAGRAALRDMRDRYVATATAALGAWSDGELTSLASALRRLHTDLTTTRPTHDSHATGQEAYA